MTKLYSLPIEVYLIKSSVISINGSFIDNNPVAQEGSYPGNVEQSTAVFESYGEEASAYEDVPNSNEAAQEKLLNFQ